MEFHALAGYRLVGGRIDRLADGTPVTYTRYRGGAAAILCVFMKLSDVAVPPAVVQMIGEHQSTSTGATVSHYPIAPTTSLGFWFRGSR